MTQTLIPSPQHAMVVSHSLGAGRWKTNLHFFTVQPVEDARDEFGGTLADALRFIEGVCCTECGTEATETREHAAFPMRCQSCGTPGCECSLIEDPHCEDVWFCTDCAPRCGCRSCMD